MSARKLTLYTDAAHLSPYAFSAYVALCEKGLPFTLQAIDLATGENRNPAYRQLSLTARVPTLVHGGFALSESSAISEYLEEAFPFPTHARLYPADIQDRARARQVQAWLRSDLAEIRGERPTTIVFQAPMAVPLSAAARAAAQRLLPGRAAAFSSGSLDQFLAAGDGAFRTWRSRPLPPRLKSSSMAPSWATAWARTPDGPKRTWSARIAGR